MKLVRGLQWRVLDIFRFLRFGVRQIPHIAPNVVNQFIEAHRREYDSLDDIVNETLHETGSDKVHLVGYSLGGVHARAYTQARPEAVSACMTWVTPHSGTPLANLGGLSRRIGLDEGVIEQISSSGAYMKELNAEFRSRRVEYKRKGVHFVNFLARWDMLVPYPNSKLPFADREYECKRSFHANAMLSKYLGDSFMKELRFLPRHPIIMLHGMMVTPEMFNPIIRRMKRMEPILLENIAHVHYDSRMEIPDYKALYSLAS